MFFSRKKLETKQERKGERERERERERDRDRARVKVATVANGRKSKAWALGMLRGRGHSLPNAGIVLVSPYQYFSNGTKCLYYQVPVSIRNDGVALQYHIQVPA